MTKALAHENAINKRVQAVWAHLKFVLEQLNVPAEILTEITTYPYPYVKTKGNKKPPPIFAFVRGWHNAPIRLYLRAEEGTIDIFFKGIGKAFSDFYIIFGAPENTVHVCANTWENVKISFNLPYTPKTEQGSDEHLFSSLLGECVSPEIRAIFACLLDADFTSGYKRHLKSLEVTQAA